MVKKEKEKKRKVEDLNSKVSVTPCHQNDRLKSFTFKRYAKTKSKSGSVDPQNFTCNDFNDASPFSFSFLGVKSAILGTHEFYPTKICFRFLKALAL